MAPAATPAPVIGSIEAAVLRAMASPALLAKLQEAGFRPAATGSAAFGAMMAAEQVRWAEVVRATGFKAIE